MRKILCALFVLTLVCGSTGIALATEAGAPTADVALEDLMVPAAESCDGPVVEAEEQITDLESQLRQPMMGGEPCNETTCSPDEFCCNFSCSICAPRGGVCIQTICE